jgi:hypothetical protein
MVADLESEEGLTGLYEELARYPLAESVMPRLERCNLRICKTFKQAPASDCDALG